MESLKVIIKAEFFDLIASGEKKIEYRNVTPFWTCRLYKNDKKRSYDKVLFINGYLKKARRMYVEFKGFKKVGDTYNIYLGKIY